MCTLLSYPFCLAGPLESRFLTFLGIILGIFALKRDVPNALFQWSSFKNWFYHKTLSGLRNERWIIWFVFGYIYIHICLTELLLLSTIGIARACYLVLSHARPHFLNLQVSICFLFLSFFIWTNFECIWRESITVVTVIWNNNSIEYWYIELTHVRHQWGLLEYASSFRLLSVWSKWELWIWR